MATWSRVTGEQAKFVEMTIEEMHQATGMPFEVLDAPAFIKEFGYTAGITGVVEPAQLRSKVELKSFESLLKERDLSELLAEKHGV